MLWFQLLPTRFPASLLLLCSFFNSFRYKLRDYWESNMWNVTNYIDTVPPVAETESMGLWELGNWVIAGALLHPGFREVVAQGSGFESPRSFLHAVARIAREAQLQAVLACGGHWEGTLSTWQEQTPLLWPSQLFYSPVGTGQLGHRRCTAVDRFFECTAV
jgi:hypothetical protein